MFKKKKGKKGQREQYYKTKPNLSYFWKRGNFIWPEHLLEIENLKKKGGNAVADVWGLIGSHMLILFFLKVMVSEYKIILTIMINQLSPLWFAQSFE